MTAQAPLEEIGTEKELKDFMLDDLSPLHCARILLATVVCNLRGVAIPWRIVGQRYNVFMRRTAVMRKSACSIVCPVTPENRHI